MKLNKILLVTLISLSSWSHAQEVAQNDSRVENLANSSASIKCTTSIDGEVVQKGLVFLTPQLGDENGAGFAILHQADDLEVNVFTNPLEIVIGEIENGRIKSFFENSLLDRLQQYVLSGGGKSVHIRRFINNRVIYARCNLPRSSAL